MTIAPQQSTSIRLVSAVAEASRGRIAYLVANGLDPAQARREAVVTIGRAVGHEASIIGSADMLILLGVMLILALAIVLGLRRGPYRKAAAPALAVIPVSRPPRDRR